MIKRKSKHEYQVNMGIRSPYTPEELKETIDWCTEIFGPSGRNKKLRWRYGWTERNEDKFYFRHEKDALFFFLKWA